MRRPLVTPPRLPPRATIGVVTPSSPAHVRFREKYLHGLDTLRSLGFTVIEGALTAQATHEGYRAGPPEARAAELQALFEDDRVDAIVATIGGSNSSSLLPHLDFDALRANPKIFCGYSDVTSLHLAMLARAGLRTFYGPAVMPSFGEWPTVLPDTLASFLDATQRHLAGPRALVAPPQWSRHFRDIPSGAWKTEPRRMEGNPGWRVLRPGRVEAPALVANLNTLLTTAGTDDFPEVDGRLLFLEEMNATHAQFERNLRHLAALGVLDRAAGLVLSKPEFVGDEGAPFGLDALLLEVIGTRRLPVVVDFDAGHTVPMLTLAEETRMAVDASGAFATVTVCEPMVVER